jgi:hypothetical protein
MADWKYHVVLRVHVVFGYSSSKSDESLSLVSVLQRAWVKPAFSSVSFCESVRWNHTATTSTKSHSINHTVSITHYQGVSTSLHSGSLTPLMFDCSMWSRVML